MMQARSILHSFKPHVVVGTGGYVCGPVVRVAVMMKVPTLLQEQNSYPGVTTRMLSHTVDEIHLTFDRSRQYLHRPKSLFVSGNPTRDGLGQAQRDDATKFFGFDQHDPKKTLLALGGSLGAHSLNQAIEKRSLQFVQHGIRLIWQTGTADYPIAKRAAERVPGSQIFVSAFIDRMDYAYAAADLVICRAGATTIAELARLGKPSILVPYPHAAANHQVENARTLVEAGAAEMIDDSEVSEKMFTVVTQLLDGSRLEEMSVRSRVLGKPDAARIIAEHVIALARH